MDHRKIPNLALALVVIASLLVGASGATSAAVPAPEVTGSAFAREGTLQDELKASPRPPDPVEKYQNKYEMALEKKEKRVDTAEREAAAARALQAGQLNPLMLEPQVTGAAAPAAVAPLAGPGQAPHYFSHPNYANSPLPTVVQVATPVGNALIDRAYATDNDPNVFVALTGAPLPAGFLTGFQTWNQATAGDSFQPSAGLRFHAYVLRPRGGALYSVIFDSGLLTVPALTTAGVSEGVTFGVANLAVQTGDVVAFYGQGIPLEIGTGSDFVSVPAFVPALPLQGSVIALGESVYPSLGQARTYSFGAEVIETGTGSISGGIRKFLNGLPGLTPAGANGLLTPGGDPDGQYISVAAKDTATYSGSDYYEIAVVQYREKMHTDLPPTLLRGYVQLAGKTPCATGTVELFNDMLLDDPDILPDRVSTGYCGVDHPHYLGATIAATKDRPVRILFRNLLPTGAGGDLFIPTDITVMGSGMGPSMWGMPETDPQTPTCGQDTKPAGCYTENRAVLHLHGGRTPWISDGTPHQWITPFGERKHLTDNGAQVENKGDSVAYVPDMWYDASGNTIATCAGLTTCGEPGATNYPGEGAQTYYYTNQQSARMLFYHDHAWGITRLNVYAGEAAGYLITDETEQKLLPPDPVTNPTGLGLIPGAADTIPLVVQDKTFVPSQAQLNVSDETWDSAKWGGEGNLWLPHVYSPAQNPGDSTGVNQYGRWAYGPWFWPPTNNILYLPVNNPYYCGPTGVMQDGVTPCAPACDPDLTWCEPPLMPGTPYNSMGMEAFHDTPLVNGTLYPTITVDPKAYRFRVLNAASDRFFNLSLYKAVDALGALCDGTTLPVPESTGVACTEVALNPAEVAAALADPTVHPTPVVGTEGPDWIQIGTEGGFLPVPVVIPAQPITWVNDPTVFNAGNVDLHSLLLGPAERADAIVDFSAFAGQTLILYNDAPAAFPARDPRYDYYTNNGDYRDIGGAPSTLPGYGPNTRTVMQIKVNGGTGTGFNLTALETAFKATTSPGGLGVFQNGQDPIIVGQGAYNSAYGTTFQNNGPDAGLVQIYDTTFSFKTLAGGAAGPSLTFPLMPKQIQDEMGEAFDHDYGRMSGFLGVESPNPQAGVQNMVLYPYVNPVSELIDMTNLPLGDAVSVTPITSATDGSQIWKVTHNGVDTHPIHFHLYDVQVLNRVGWDGIIRKPDLNELGWKDTVRISPLEDTVVALRPVRPVVPFDQPNSVRRLNPAQPLGSQLGFNNQDLFGQPTQPITNDVMNFGWEYVWHCHILSHEEMDMMRPQTAAVPPAAPTGLTAAVGPGGVVLDWTDNSKNETGFLVQRSLTGGAPWTDVAAVAADVMTFTDSGATPGQINYYQVFAVNKVGYPGPAAQPNAYPTLQVSSTAATVQFDVPLPPPATPTVLTAVYQPGPQVLLTWTDNATTETGFVVQRCTGAGCTSFAGSRDSWAVRRHRQCHLHRCDRGAEHHLSLSGGCRECGRPIRVVEHRNRSHTECTGGTLERKRGLPATGQQRPVHDGLDGQLHQQYRLHSPAVPQRQLRGRRPDDSQPRSERHYVGAEYKPAAQYGPLLPDPGVQRQRHIRLGECRAIPHSHTVSSTIAQLRGREATLPRSCAKARCEWYNWLSRPPRTRFCSGGGGN